MAGAVHGRHVPPGAKEVHRLGEAIVVDEAGVHGEQPHQQQDIAAVEEHPQDLVEVTVMTDSPTGQWLRGSSFWFIPATPLGLPRKPQQQCLTQG